jgi:elongation factor G
MDKEHADFASCLEQLREAFGNRVLPVAWPIGQGEGFQGVVDLLKMKAVVGPADGKGKPSEGEIPGEVQSEVEKWRKELLEAAAEGSEELMEKYLEEENLSEEDLLEGLTAGVAAGEIYPVFCTAAPKLLGVHHLLDGLVQLVPSPKERPKRAEEPSEEIVADPEGPAAAFVFKNVSESHVGDMLFVRVYRGKLVGGTDIYNLSRQTSERLGQLFCLQGKNRSEVNELHAGDIGAVVKLKSTRVGDSLCDKANPVRFPQIQFPKPSVFSAIAGKAKGDEDKIGTGLNRLAEEDPTITVTIDNEIRQTLLGGQGELHLEVVVGRLKRRFGVDVELSRPKIPYKETITKTAQAQGKYKKQTGGRGQYGDVWIKIEPLPRGGGFEFVDAIVGGVVPSKFVPAVEKGIKSAMEEGVLAGYPVVDLKATLYDGSYHSVDSSEQSFKIAGSLAIK